MRLASRCCAAVRVATAGSPGIGSARGRRPVAPRLRPGRALDSDRAIRAPRTSPRGRSRSTTRSGQPFRAGCCVVQRLALGQRPQHQLEMRLPVASALTAASSADWPSPGEPMRRSKPDCTSGTADSTCQRLATGFQALYGTALSRRRNPHDLPGSVRIVQQPSRIPVHLARRVAPKWQARLANAPARDARPVSMSDRRQICERSRHVAMLLAELFSRMARARSSNGRASAADLARGIPSRTLSAPRRQKDGSGYAPACESPQPGTALAAPWRSRRVSRPSAPDIGGSSPRTHARAISRLEDVQRRCKLDCAAV